MGIKFPTPWETLIIKFPCPRDGKSVKCPGFARGGACWSFDLTDTLRRKQTEFHLKKWTWAPIKSKPKKVCGELKKSHFKDTVRWHWSANTLFWELSIDHNRMFNTKLNTDSICLGLLTSKCAISHPLTWWGGRTDVCTDVREDDLVSNKNFLDA